MQTGHTCTKISLLPSLSRRTKVGQLKTVLSYQLADGTEESTQQTSLTLYLLLISYIFIFSQFVALETQGPFPLSYHSSEIIIIFFLLKVVYKLELWATS